MATKDSKELAELKQNNRVAATRRRYASAALEGALVRKGAGAVTAATIGAMSRAGVPKTVAGFPWKVGVIAVAQLAEGLSKGNVQAAAAGVADATTAIYIMRSIVTGSIVAGEIDDDDDGGEI